MAALFVEGPGEGHEVDPRARREDGQVRHQPRTPIRRSGKPSRRAVDSSSGRVSGMRDESDPDAEIEHGAHLGVAHAAEGLYAAEDRRHGPVEAEARPRPSGMTRWRFPYSPPPVMWAAARTFRVALSVFISRV